MTHGEKIARWIRPGTIGTEIGAGAAPVPGLVPAPIYVDCFKTFGATPNRADYFGQATALPFHDHSLDYVITSHVLEHVANPVAALAEWYRVVKPGGIIYLVVPDRRATWEHARGLTPVEHLLEDYERGTTACDATHIDEFVYEADWSLFSPKTPAEAARAEQEELAKGMHWAVTNGEEINIHFHTFEPASLRALLKGLTGAGGPPKSGAAGNGAAGLRAVPRFNWELVDFAERFPTPSPNGILAVLRVHKGWLARAEIETARLLSNGATHPVLKDDAKPFADWIETAPGLGGAH